ncbi:MAG: outer membrane lipoprotein carrier protein LolA [Bacteroidales bacterium]|nr:outer membrane lipoprotein carrier protein LolA [Bacteroidales bacterium]
MKKVTAIIGIILTVMVGAAQAQTMANQLVKNTIDNINKHKNVEFVFDYDMSNETIAVTESASGTAYMQGEAYKMEIEGQQIISDGKTLWTYLIDDEEVMVSNPTDDDNIITPIKMLTTYDKDYTIKYGKSNEKGIKVVEMSNPKGEFSKVTLKINEAKLEIVSATISNRSGDAFTIRIKKTVFDQDLDAKFFTFDEKAHPKVDVIDMR